VTELDAFKLKEKKPKRIVSRAENNGRLVSGQNDRAT
jgi:hypothetical protein